MRSLALLVLCQVAYAAPPKTYGDAVARLAPEVCDRRVRCGEIGAHERAACIADPGQTKTLALDDHATLDALAHGRLRFEPGAFDACVAAYRGACGARVACGLLVPAVKPGGACTSWGECLDGHCSAQPGCTGHCVAHKHHGERCSASGDDGLCDDATFCDPSQDTCIPKLAALAKCTAWNSCADGLRCVGAGTVREEPGAPEEERPGSCIGGGAGAACKPGYHECEPGFACDFESATCVARIARGKRCRSPESCADGLACAGLAAMWDPHGARWRVGTEGTCTPWLDVGAACDVFAYETGCPASTRCNAKTARCEHAGLAGNACEPNGCRGNLSCSARTHTCTPKLRLGAACSASDDDPCALGRCDPARHVCVPLQACRP